MTRIIDNFAEISSFYDAAFVDLWGCMHNGITAYDEAVAACRAFRAEGGKVILLTNAPRPRASIAEQLKRFNVPEDCWDSIASSGDSARLALFSGAVGSRVYFIGEERDLPFFEPLKMVDTPLRNHPCAAGGGRRHRCHRSLPPRCRARGDATAIPAGQADGPETALRQSRYHRRSRRHPGVLRRGAGAALYRDGRREPLFRQAATGHL